MLPIALARVNGVPTRAGLPRLVRRGFEWGIDAPEGYEDGRPLVLVDVLGSQGRAFQTDADGMVDVTLPAQSAVILVPEGTKVP